MMAAPAGWKRLNLSDVLSRKLTYGIVQPGEYQTNGKVLIRSQDYSAGWQKLEGMMRVAPEIETPYSRSRVSKGDLLITVVGANIGKIASVPDWLDGANISRSVARVSVAESIAIPAYVKVYLQGGIRHLLHLNSNGGAQPVLNLDDLRQFQVPLPPLYEQQKIADILGMWDNAMEKLDALVVAKERCKQGLMQQLLTGKRRLPASGAPVNFIRASEIFTNRTERNIDGAPILSVTQDQGVVLRDTLERKISHDAESVETYKVVSPGDYIVSLRSFQGGLEYSEIRGAVSPAYHVLRPIKAIDRDFYRHYFKSAHFIGHLAVAVIGIRDGKQISLSDFGFIKLPYPHIEDQKRIGRILSAADEELRLLRDQRIALDQQKRGLMQQLLTGKIRVTPHTT